MTIYIYIITTTVDTLWIELLTTALTNGNMTIVKLISRNKILYNCFVHEMPTFNM